MIKIQKSKFKLVPAGDRTMTVTKVDLLPPKHPIAIKMTFTDCEGAGTIIDNTKLSNSIACQILGGKCDVALGGKLPEGSDIDENDIPDMFMGKTFIVHVKHTASKKDPDMMYANVSYLKELVDAPVADDEDDDLE